MRPEREARMALAVRYSPSSRRVTQPPNRFPIRDALQEMSKALAPAEARDGVKLLFRASVGLARF